MLHIERKHLSKDSWQMLCKDRSKRCEYLQGWAVNTRKSSVKLWASDREIVFWLRWYGWADWFIKCYWRLSALMPGMQASCCVSKVRADKLCFKNVKIIVICQNLFSTGVMFGSEWFPYHHETWVSHLVVLWVSDHEIVFWLWWWPSPEFGKWYKTAKGQNACVAYWN